MSREIVGKSKIAKMAGVSTSAVDLWRRRDDFPAPAAIASVVESGPGSYPVWYWDEIAAWLDNHQTLGRRPE